MAKQRDNELNKIGKKRRVIRDESKRVENQREQR